MTSSANVAPHRDELNGQTAERGDAAPERRGWSLTVYFALLVGVVAVATAAASVYVYVQTDRDSRHTAENNARHASQTAAAQLGSGIATVKATVAGLAKTPNLAKVAVQPTCTLSFAIDGLSRGHLDVLRPDGSVACSSRQPTGDKPLVGYAGAGWPGQLKQGELLAAPVVDRATGERSLLTAVRAPDRSIVAAFVALAPIGPELAKLYGGGYPVEFVATSADGTRVLLRSNDPARWVGASRAGTPFAGASGTGEHRDVEGRSRLYEQAVVPGVGWHFFAGEDKTSALAAGEDLRTRQLGIILAGFALVVLATLAVYRRVAVPIRRLGANVRASSASSPPEPVPVSGPAEVSDLGNDVNDLIRSARDELRGRERAEEVTLASERSYRSLFESSPLPMWIHDAATLEMLAVNDAAVSRFGYTREEFLALRTRDLVFADDAVELSVTTRRRRKDGAELKVRTFVHSLPFDGHDALCVVSEDIGERERLESRLRQAQKMEAIGQLAGGVAHDFNNLLTVIAGYGRMARKRIGTGPGARELAEIDRASERAAQLTQQLLAFSRQQVIEPVVLDVNDVIESVTPMLNRLIGEDIEIGVLTDDGMPAVLADRGQVEQVIVNLAVNARDAMPNGGTLTIETRGVRLDERYAVDHAGVRPGSYASLSVTDTGVGIDSVTQARIFEPFFTTKEVGAGTGLGLATVHGIVTQSGGHLEVYSEPGLGTSFKVYFPATLGEVALDTDAQPRHTRQLTGTETLLVCEDDRLVQTLIQSILVESGYRVLCASRPQEALELAESHDGPISVLVTDVVMPQMSGPELVERIETIRPDMRILFLSGYSGETLRNRALPEGSAFLEKPFDEVSLLEAIRTLLETDAQVSTRAAGAGSPPPARLR